MSAQKILTAARTILDLIYSLWSTSYDITLADLSCTHSWLMAGRILVRFLKVAQEAESHDQITTLRTEVEFIQLALLLPTFEISHLTITSTDLLLPKSAKESHSHVRLTLGSAGNYDANLNDRSACQNAA